MKFDPALDGLIDLLAEALVRRLEGKNGAAAPTKQSAAPLKDERGKPITRERQR